MFREWKALALQAMIRSIFRAQPIVPALFVFAGEVLLPECVVGRIAAQSSRQLEKLVMRT
jgi:hypothetical protein